MVTDINDNSPIFIGPGLVGKTYTFSVKEGLTPPKIIGTVKVITERIKQQLYFILGVVAGGKCQGTYR